ncbi:MAG TPA: DNA-binding domain-containing protein [Gammaproteobacteria bacterium]|nr:DNA-binding domain-containing protein [Gammaproteobacteria bacterium]
MTSLRELQRDFAGALFDERSPDFTPQPARFQIYRNNVLSNLVDALASVYGAVKALVGDEFFEHAAERYARRTPSLSGNLNDFGADFGAFLATLPGASDLPYLGDVARLEWSAHLALLAPDAGPADFSALAALAPGEQERVRLRLHPSVHLLESPYPLLRIWELCQPDTPQTGAGVSLDEGAARLLVARPRLKVEITELTPGPFALLAAVHEGQGFAVACERALEVDAGLDIPAFVQAQAAAGVIVDWEV